MSTSVASVVSHFPDAENGFTTTTAGSVSSGAATVTLNSVAGYTNGEPVVLVIDPTDASKKQTFTGIVDTSGVQITSVVWTAGTNQTHALGATVVDYATATHIAMISKGIKVGHTQKGNHKTLTDDNANEWIELGTTASAINQVKISNAAISTGPTIEASGDDTNIDLVIKPKGTGKIKPGFLDGWSYNTLPSVSSVTNNGNRSYDVTFGSTVASYLTPGMRVRTSRTVAAPTGALTLNGTTQYASKSSPAGTTFTDDFCAGAWVKLSSYPSGNTGIISRYNGTSGWILGVNANGGIFFTGYNGGAGNYSGVNSYQSLPLNKWVHVAAQLDMSAFTATTTTSYIMLDGVDVPATVGRAGTNPTALVQAGDLTVGAANATGFLPGRVAQAWYSNAKITQANIKPFISQTMSGSETSIVSAFKLDQASGLNDLNANANNLTATGSPTYSVDSPFTTDANGTPGGTYDFGIVTKVATTVATIQTCEGCTIATSGGVSAVDLSAYKSPFGFPAQKGRWRIESICTRSLSSQSTPSASTWYNVVSAQLSFPVGDWMAGYATGLYVDRGAAGTVNVKCTLSSANNTELDRGWTSAFEATGGTTTSGSARLERPLSFSAQTSYYLNLATNQASMNGIYFLGDREGTVIYADPSHL